MATRRPLVLLDDSTISELPAGDDLPATAADLRLNFAYSQNVTPPAFGALVTVPTATTEREVYFALALEAGTLASSSVTVEVETGIGTGIYTQVLRLRLAPGTSPRTLPGAFVVPSGRRYRFVEDMTDGTRAFVFYSFRDISAVSDSHVDNTAIHFTLEDVDDRVAGLIQNGTGISWSYDDVANTLTPAVSLSPFSTSNLAEGVNLYYTQARFDSAFAAKSTSNLSEGSNLYFTDERVDDRVSALIKNGTGISWAYDDVAGTFTPTITLAPFSTSNLSEGSNLYYTQARFDSAFAAKSTTNLSEGSNLYFTDERVDDRVSALINNGTGLSWVYDDVANTFTGNVSLSPFSTTNLSEGSNLYYTDERVDDRVALLVVAGNQLTKTYDDVAGTLTLNVSEGAGSGLDADLLDGQHGSFYQNASNLNAGTVPTGRLTGTYSISVSGNAGTATTLQTARTINSVSFDGSTNIVVEPFVERDDATNATRYLTFVDSVTAGYQRLNMDNGLTYNPSTGLLGASVSGNAGTATVLQTARTINGTSFNGSANITTASWGTARTLTIGSTGKSVNGGANVSWSLGEIGAAAAVHTHTASSITDFSEAVDDRVNGLLSAGKNIELTYNDPGNVLTITAEVPYISVVDEGALGNDSADDYSVINSVISTLAANGGGVAYFKGDGRVYRISQKLVISANAITLLGEGVSPAGLGSTIRASFTTGDVIEITGQHSGLSNLKVDYVGIPTSGFAVKFGPGSFMSFAEKVRCDGVYNGFGISGGTETKIKSCMLRSTFGDVGIEFTGTNTNKSFRAVIDDFQADNPYPHGEPVARGAWAGSTSYAVGQAVYNDGFKIYQCKTAGTSAASGGPTGTGQSISDGTVVWDFVSGPVTWIKQNNYAYSLVIDKAVCLNGLKGFSQEDAANTGSSYPIWAFVWDLECDHNYLVGIDLIRGEGAYIHGSWIGSCLWGNGLIVQPSHRGEVAVDSGTRIMGNAESGALIQAGPVEVMINGSFIGDNSKKASGTFHGINVAAGASRFYLQNNRSGELPGGGANSQGFGVFINTGASNDYIVMGNNLKNNLSGGLFDGGSGTSKIISPNLT